jgi:hypothetical protein
MVVLLTWLFWWCSGRQFDPEAGTLRDLALVAEVGVSPSWFRWHPTLPVLYCTNETMFGEDRRATLRVACAGPLPLEY